ncbi:MAG: hypothetical protein ABJN84_17240 [Flavobacteriaceae bacterium]
MIKYSPFINFLFLLCCSISWSQNKYEQEYRISQSEFPSNAYNLISQQLESSKRIRFYKEIDSVKKSFEAKFKKGKLHYSIEFDKHGNLEDIEFQIKEVDIPEDSWSSISTYLIHTFRKVRIVKIQQQYPIDDGPTEKIIKQAFQNLILPYINYEIVFTAKGKKGFLTYEALFNAEGKLVKLRKSLSSSYNHVLF